MNKKIILGFLLIGTIAYGGNKIGNDIGKNKIKIENIKLENNKLRGEVDRLKELLNKLKTKFIKEINFENLGIYIIRRPRSFTLRIDSNDINKESYYKLFDTISNAMKYDISTSMTILGNHKNIETLKSYFLSKDIDILRLKLEVIDLRKAENITKSNENGTQLSITKIILKKNKLL